MSLYRFFWPPCERFTSCCSAYNTFLGSRSSGILITWPVHLSCASFKTVCILCIPAFFRTSVSGILSCHLIFNSFLKQLKWKRLSLCMTLVYCPGLTCIQEGWQYHSLVDFQLGVKLEYISLPDICTESSKCQTGFCNSGSDLIIRKVLPR